MKALVLAAILASGCVTTETQSRTWSGPGRIETGEVANIREVVHTVRGNPAAGALAGAVVGGLLFRGSGPSTLFGAAAGAGVGAAASSGSAQSRTYEVNVRLDSGQWATFGYANYAPFQPGERVEIVDGQLRPMPY